MSLATRVYEEAAKAAQQEQATEGQTTEKKDDNIKDAEYEEK